MRANLLILFLVMLSLVSVVHAQFAGGSGTIDDPYLVQTASQLNSVRNFPFNHFRQISDIDLNVAPYNHGQGWQPLGFYNSSSDNAPFTGSYDGGLYYISNLYINRPNLSQQQGLFGYAAGAVLKKINIWAARISGQDSCGGLLGWGIDCTVDSCLVSGTISGSSEVGGLIGIGRNCIYCNCRVYGTITGTGDYNGGLVGSNFYSSIYDCYVAADVIGYRYVGGMVGDNMGGTANQTVFQKCHTTGNVTGSLYTGGFAGHVENVEINNCFARGNVTGGSVIGGLIGLQCINSSVINCYSTGHVSGYQTLGGLIGDCLGYVAIASYWDMETSGQSVSDGGTGATSTQMVYPYGGQIYNNWDFNNLWHHDVDNSVNNGYPYLQIITEIDTVDAPVISPPTNIYETMVQTSISCDTPDALIYYTTDDSEPTQNSTLYTQPFYAIPLTVFGITVKARAFKPGSFPSGIAAETYFYPDANQDEPGIPIVPAIRSIAPNPFQHRVAITFILSKADQVSLQIYNQKGQLVKTLTDNLFSKGEHKLEWDATDNKGKPVSGGVYFLRMNGSDFHQTRKLLLMK